MQDVAREEGSPISREHPAVSLQLKIFQEKGRTGLEGEARHPRREKGLESFVGSGLIEE
jgi:hypothetical protein